MRADAPIRLGPGKSPVCNGPARSLLPHPGLGHERNPALDLGGVVLGELLRGKPGGLETDGAKLVLDVALLDDAGDGLAQGRANLRRQARRPIDAEPPGELDAANGFEPTG